MLDTKKIAALREELGLTQQEAATRAGFETRQQWNRIERGYDRISLDTLFKIAKALKADPRDLLKPRR